MVACASLRDLSTRFDRYDRGTDDGTGQGREMSWLGFPWKDGFVVEVAMRCDSFVDDYLHTEDIIITVATAAVAAAAAIDQRTERLTARRSIPQSQPNQPHKATSSSQVTAQLLGTSTFHTINPQGISLGIFKKLHQGRRSFWFNLRGLFSTSSDDFLG